MKKPFSNFSYSNYLSHFMRLLDSFRMTNALIAVISIHFFSCETLVNDVDPDRLPRSDSKLVVHGYLSPQDTVISVAVNVSTQLIGGSLNLGNNTTASLSDATVTLSNQGKQITLPFDSKSGTYRVKANSLPIIEGQTYHLKVLRNGESTESSCTVPQGVAIQSIRKDSVDSRGSVSVKDYLYHIVWKDPEGQANYYRVGGYIFQTQRVQTGPNMFENMPNIQPLNFRENNRSGEFISDERTDGLLLVSIAGRAYSYYSQGVSPFTNQYVELILLSCEKTYYEYHRAVQNFDGNNPFAEPSLIPSNIKNGLGCFAAYNRSTFILKN
jgi:hypothetical protein